MGGISGRVLGKLPSHMAQSKQTLRFSELALNSELNLGLEPILKTLLPSAQSFSISIF